MLMIFGQPSRCGREGSKAAGEHEQRIAASGGNGGARGRSREARRRRAGGGTYILFQLRAFPAVERIRDAHPAADDAAPSVRAVVALVTDAHESAGAHQRVAHHALAVACGARRARGGGTGERRARAQGARQKGASRNRTTHIFRTAGRSRCQAASCTSPDLDGASPSNRRSPPPVSTNTLLTNE